MAPSEPSLSMTSSSTSIPVFDLETFRVPSDVDEAFYIPNFITLEEEEYLLRKVTPKPVLSRNLIYLISQFKIRIDNGK